jgi:hypothetical protein
MAPVLMRAVTLRQRRGLVAFVATLLLLSQWLAVAHSVVHLPGQGPAVVHGRSEASASPLARALYELVTQHDNGSGTCQLLDQLCHGAPDAPAVALPSVLPADAGVAAPVTSARASARWSEYLARAPPALA